MEVSVKRELTVTGFFLNHVLHQLLNKYPQHQETTKNQIKLSCFNFFTYRFALSLTVSSCFTVELENGVEFWDALFSFFSCTSPAETTSKL